MQEGIAETYHFKDNLYLSSLIQQLDALNFSIDEMACTPDGDWVLVDGVNVYHSTQFPQDALQKIYEYIHMGKEIDCIAFTPKDGWMIIAEDQAWRSGSISYLTLLEQQVLNLINNNVRIRELVFDADNDGWALLADNYVYMKEMPREFHDGVADGASSKRAVNRASTGFDGTFCIMSEDWYATQGADAALVAGLKSYQKTKKGLDRVMIGPKGSFVLYSNAPFVPDFNKNIKKLEYKIRAGVDGSGNTVYKNIWQRMEELNIPGVSIGIIEDNQLVWARGYGEMEKGTQRFVRRDTAFDTASVSKSFGAAGILTYMDDPGSQMHIWTSVWDASIYGNILTNPLFNWTIWSMLQFGVDHLPTPMMTVERLLSHTACLEPWGALAFKNGQAKPKTLGLLTGAYYDDNNILQSGGSHTIFYNPNILGDGKSYLPGDVYRYSGGGYYVAQVMTEIFSGKPFHEIVKSNLFEPLEMNDSAVLQPFSAQFKKHAASPHGKDGKLIPAADQGYYPWITESGLFTSARDFSQFIIMLNQKGVAPNGKQVIMPLYVKEMLKDHTPEEDIKYGFGVSLSANFVNDTNNAYYAHGGAHAGAITQMAGHPTKKQGIIILCNRGYSQAQQFVGELYNTYKGIYGW